MEKLIVIAVLLRRSGQRTARARAHPVIGLDGRVTSVKDQGSNIPDPGVVDCCVDGFKTLRFDPPEGGIVTVVYPIIFNPGD